MATCYLVLSCLETVTQPGCWQGHGVPTWQHVYAKGTASTTVLHKLGTVGVAKLACAGFDAGYMLRHERCLRTRIAAIEQRAAHLVGGSINLSSASQVAVALYDTLALPPPPARSDRSDWLQALLHAWSPFDGCIPMRTACVLCPHEYSKYS